jgi:SPP1 gp7 family putative phage head morphogenesis protein
LGGEDQLKAIIRQGFALQNTADKAVLQVDQVLAQAMSNVKQLVESLPEESLLRGRAWKDLEPLVKQELNVYGQQLGSAIENALVDAEPEMERAAIRQARLGGADFGPEAVSINPVGGRVQGTVERALNSRVNNVTVKRLFNIDGKTKTAAIDKSLFRTVDTAVRAGMINGTPTDEIARSMIGEVKRAGIPGVDINSGKVSKQIRTQANAIARTATQDMARQVKQEVYDANADAMEGMEWQWTTALDSRTCETCSPLDGRRWKDQREVPGWPLHPNCRCQSLPVDPEDPFWDNSEVTAQVIRPFEKGAYADGYKTPVKINGKKFYRQAVTVTSDAPPTRYSDVLARWATSSQTSLEEALGPTRARWFKKEYDRLNKDPQQILQAMLTGKPGAQKFIPIEKLLTKEVKLPAKRAVKKAAPKPKVAAPKAAPKQALVKPKAETFTPLEKLTNEQMVSELEKKWDIPVPKGLRDERQLLADQLADMRGVTRLGSSRLGEIDELIEKNKSLVSVGQPREVSGNTRLAREFNDAETVLGKGTFGEARLTSKGDVIKSGAIGQDEVKAMQRLERFGISPVLKDAEAHTDLVLGGGREADGASAFIGKYNGMLKMSRAKGQSMLDYVLDGEEKTTGLAESFLRSSKKMHLQGVAHNDRHMQNIFVDDKNVSFLDFGLAQTDSRAALVEALGNDDPVFDRQGGDLFLTTNLGKSSVWQVFRKNKVSVISKLKASGKGSKLLKKEIRTSGETLSELISEKEAQALLVELYEGI